MSCKHCGDADQITDRSYRRKVAEGREHYCRTCLVVQSVKLEASDIRYWTKRFSQEDLEAMVSAIL